MSKVLEFIWEAAKIVPGYALGWLIANLCGKVLLEERDLGKKKILIRYKVWEIIVVSILLEAHLLSGFFGGEITLFTGFFIYILATLYHSWKAKRLYQFLYIKKDDKTESG